MERQTFIKIPTDDLTHCSDHTTETYAYIPIDNIAWIDEFINKENQRTWGIFLRSPVAKDETKEENIMPNVIVNHNPFECPTAHFEPGDYSEKLRKETEQ